MEAVVRPVGVWGLYPRIERIVWSEEFLDLPMERGDRRSILHGQERCAQTPVAVLCGDGATVVDNLVVDRVHEAMGDVQLVAPEERTHVQIAVPRMPIDRRRQRVVRQLLLHERDRLAQLADRHADVLDDWWGKATVRASVGVEDLYDMAPQRPEF